MKRPSTEKVLLDCLRATQTLLALIANDPGDPAHIRAIVSRFNLNKAILAELKDPK